MIILPIELLAVLLPCQVDTAPMLSVEWENMPTSGPLRNAKQMLPGQDIYAMMVQTYIEMAVIIIWFIVYAVSKIENNSDS
jgi:hypothetical protein